MSYKIQKIFFLNKDTGWVGSSDVNGKLYRTTNGGVNWNLQFTFISHVDAIYFLNNTNGWLRAATNLNNVGVAYTTNGGNNWTNAVGNTIGGFDVKFINDSIGYAGTFDFPKVMKSTNGGRYWGYQTTPIGSGSQVSVIKGDTSNVWAGSIMHTKDGGGQVIVTSVKSDIGVTKNFVLFQNYPNPFNPKTIINYEIGFTSNVKLEVYDISGRMIKQLVSQKQNPGNYNYTFDGSDLPSAVYFYKLTTEDFTETRKMILAK
ncbi:MAG: T9SS type A sorting domain-containing protein [Ignavibacteria bacterium]|nr:T9SS type A sorting domain-containing protein [Ignavibacteria bacterium]